MNFPKKVKTQINMILEKTITDYGEGRINSIEDVARLAWIDARSLLENELENLGIEYLKDLIRGRMKAFSPVSRVIQPEIPGIDIINLPTRIAVSRSLAHVETEHDLDGLIKTDQISWVVTRRATIRELEDNLAMRDRLIQGSVAVRNKIKELVDAARRAGGKDDDVVIDVMRAAHAE